MRLCGQIISPLPVGQVQVGDSDRGFTVCSKSMTVDSAVKEARELTSDGGRALGVYPDTHATATARSAIRDGVNVSGIILSVNCRRGWCSNHYCANVWMRWLLL